MSYLITALIYKEGEFDAQWIRKAYDSVPTEDKDQFESMGFHKVKLKNEEDQDMKIVFFFIGGFNNKNQAFNAQVDFLFDSGFLGILFQNAKASGKPFKYFFLKYNDMSGPIRSGSLIENDDLESRTLEGSLGTLYKRVNGVKLTEVETEIEFDDGPFMDSNGDIMDENGYHKAQYEVNKPYDGIAFMNEVYGVTRGNVFDGLYEIGETDELVAGKIVN